MRSRKDRGNELSEIGEGLRREADLGERLCLQISPISSLSLALAFCLLFLPLFSSVGEVGRVGLDYDAGPNRFGLVFRVGGPNQGFKTQGWAENR